MTMRPSSPSDPRDTHVEKLLRAAPPIERAPAWLRSSTMDQIRRARSVPTAASSAPSASPSASILWRLAPLAGLAAVLLGAALIFFNPTKPGSPTPLAVAPTVPPVEQPTIPEFATTATADAFRTLRSLARRPDLRPDAVVHARMETPLLREARLVVQDSENVARAVLARLPSPPAMP